MSIPLKTYSDTLQQFLNHPGNYNEPSQIQQAIQCLKQLCHCQAKLQITFSGIWQCSFCFNPIMLNSQYKQLQCGHCIHQRCIQSLCEQKDPNLDIGVFLIFTDLSQKLTGIKCNICGYELKSAEAYSYLDKQKLEQIYYEQARKIDQQLAEQNKQLAAKKTFECAICMDDALEVNRECITLECDHRACKECLENYLTDKIQNGQVQATDLVCPQSGCNIEIDQAIIQYVVSKEVFEKYITFGFTKLTSTSENQIFIRCPTPNCNMIFEYEKGTKETRFVCPVCNKKFCALGCDDPHEGCTCEQYKQWKIENGQADQAFDLIVQQQGIRKCPFCQAYVLRNGGCNHMTCLCKREFCYVCEAEWKGSKCLNKHGYYDPEV